MNLVINFLDAKKQRFTLNDQYSSRANLKSVVPSGSTLGPLFSIFINDLFIKLVSNIKLFADGTSLFPVVQYITLSAKNSTDNLEKINKWPFQWKMSFNLCLNKQSQEVIFTVIFKLDFQEHYKDQFSKISKTIRLLRKLHKILTRPLLLRI